jgi:hypothetical protein
MGVSDRDWRLWRDEPDFSPLEFPQRYTGTFGDDGRVITDRGRSATTVQPGSTTSI